MENQTKRTKQMSEEAMTQQRESEQRMSKTLNKLSKFQEQEVTQRDVMYILFEGTRQFAALKYQWTHLLQFLTDDVVEPFSQLCMKVSNIIELPPKSPLYDFKKNTNANKYDNETMEKIRRLAID